MSDKNELLEELEPLIAPSMGMGVRYLLFVLLMMSLVFMFAFPKIYLKNKIYYKSRELAKLKREYDALKEENHIIKRKVEAIKFKNQILDTLF